MIDRLAKAREALGTAYSSLQDALYHLEEAERDDEADNALLLAIEVQALLADLGGKEP